MTTPLGRLQVNGNGTVVPSQEVELGARRQAEPSRPRMVDPNDIRAHARQFDNPRSPQWSLVAEPRFLYQAALGGAMGFAPK